MLSEGEIIINKVAQDKLSIEEGLQWFKNSEPTEYRSILARLRLYLEQAHPDQQLIDDNLGNVPLKITMTPIVLFKTHPFKVAALAVCDLPDNELEKSFTTLLTLFKYADTARRELYCKNGCTHEWHNFDKLHSPYKGRLLTRIKKFFG
nr:DUF5958 family protein [uncultured Flavobacterium sp.]